MATGIDFRAWAAALALLVVTVGAAGGFGWWYYGSSRGPLETRQTREFGAPQWELGKVSPEEVRAANAPKP